MTAERMGFRIAVILTLLFVFTGSLFAQDEKKDNQTRIRNARIEANTADSFVTVHYHFKKSDRPKLSDEQGGSYYYDEDDYLSMILAKRTKDIAGIIINDKGDIFVEDNYAPVDVVERITVTGPDGKSYQAKQGPVLTKTSGQIIRLVDKIPNGLKPLSFSEAPDVLTDSFKLYSISLRLSSRYDLENLEDGYFSINPAAAMKKWGNSGKVPDYYSITDNTPAVLCDANGLVLGVTALDKIEQSDDAPAWRGKDILSDEGFARAEGIEKIKAEFADYLYKVTMTFRPPPKEDDEYDMGRFGAFWGSWGGGDDDSKELLTYALAVSPKRFLLPSAMPQEMVVGIDTITVEIGEEEVPARFCGVLKQCRATVIECNEPVIKNVINIDPKVSPERTDPFWTVFARDLAGKDLLVDYNRWIYKQKGYANKKYRAITNQTRNGSWLLDREGRFAGLYIEPRLEHERLMPYLQGEYYGYSGMMGFGGISRRFYGGDFSSDDSQIFSAGDLVAILNDLPANFDPYIRHLSKDQQKRRPWLGIEFTGITKEMAKQLDLRKPTQDGRIGLMINRVYPASPASKMGLTEGDVLLKLFVTGTPWPIELKLDDDYDFDRPDFDDFDIPDEFETMGYEMPRKRPWKSRENFFTSMLDKIGQGTEVQLTYLHNGEKMQKEFVVEQSPRDALSASKYKDSKLGMTVKDLTYEVRAGMKLSDDYKGIVISKVEPGTPTALARLNVFDLIRAVDGNDISSVDEFEQAIKAAREQDKKSVRITAEWMGKTRLADLKFEANGDALGGIRRLFPGFPKPGGSDM